MEIPCCSSSVTRVLAYHTLSNKQSILLDFLIMSNSYIHILPLQDWPKKSLTFLHIHLHNMWKWDYNQTVSIISLWRLSLTLYKKRHPRLGVLIREKVIMIQALGIVVLGNPCSSEKPAPQPKWLPVNIGTPHWILSGEKQLLTTLSPPKHKVELLIISLYTCKQIQSTIPICAHNIIKEVFSMFYRCEAW